MIITPVPASDPDAQTADPVAANLQALRTLFPDAFTEGKIDFDMLRQLLGDAVEDGDERYGLSWSGKRRARRLALQPSLGTLRPAKEDSANWGTTQNLVIEGDNLEVLKLLTKPYAGKVKLIYIDPPYNTGNDFVYPDDYADSLGNYLRRTGQMDGDGAKNTSNPESSGRYHTNWLNMMYPRLMLARGLLAKDGVILVYVDDVEVGGARALLDAIFGEENHVSTLVVDRNRKNDAKFFSVGHEYIHCYFRDAASFFIERGHLRSDKPGVDLVRQRFDELRFALGDDWQAISSRLVAFYASLSDPEAKDAVSRFRKVDEKGPYRDDGNINWPGGGGPRYEVLHPITKRPVKIPTSGWRYPTPERFWEEHASGRIVFGSDEMTVPRVRTNLFENDGQVLGSVWFSYAQTSTNELTALMGGERVFSNPKPLTDVRKLITYLTPKDGIVLDFFAGSGTTGHAVMAQNAADGGKRRYILVQLPEPLDLANKDQKTAAKFCDTIGKPRTIAELTKERLRRAAAKIGSEHLDTTADLGFRVYKLATSNLKAWQPRMESAEALAADLAEAADNLLPGRTEDDLLVELLLKRGIDLAEPMLTRTEDGRTYQAFGGGVLITYLGDVTAADAEAIATTIADWIVALNPVAPVVVFFRDIGFENDVAKANVDAVLRQRLRDRGLRKPDLLEAVRSI